jgi:hypothetical protein
MERPALRGVLFSGTREAVSAWRETNRGCSSGNIDRTAAVHMARPNGCAVQ